MLMTQHWMKQVKSKTCNVGCTTINKWNTANNLARVLRILFNSLDDLHELLFVKQVCIPVGCVPPASVATVNRMTDKCKSITLPQTSFVGGNKLQIHEYLT